MTNQTKLNLVKRQFVQYILGKSLLEVGKEFGVSKETVRLNFLKYIHPNYQQLKKSGVSAEVKRYLLSKYQSDRNKDLIRNWFFDNLHDILEVDNNDVSFFSENKLNQLTRAETGKYSDLLTWPQF